MKNLSLTIIFTLLFQSIAFANSNVDVNQFVLPSEAEGIPKAPGAVYYSKAVKNKVLIPTHFWGEMTKNGLHFVPTDTSLIKGISIAGGPKTDSDLSEVVVKRLEGQTLKEYEFDLTDGGDQNAHTFKLRAGDAVYIKKDHYRADRAWYTSLVGVAATIITSLFIIEQVNQN